MLRARRAVAASIPLEHNLSAWTAIFIGLSALRQAAQQYLSWLVATHKSAQSKSERGHVADEKEDLGLRTETEH